MQIVGHEFDYGNEFFSLTTEINGMRDLCDRCMKIAEEAAGKSLKAQGQVVSEAVGSALKNSDGYWGNK